MKDAGWSDITEACYQKEIDLTSKYMFKDTDVNGYDIYGCACTEVEVDILTGKVQLKRVDILEDVGESMSPSVDVGQVNKHFVHYQNLISIFLNIINI